MRALVALAVLWLAGLVIASFALEPTVRGRIADRLAESLQAEATIERGDLALVRGKVALDGVAVRRRDLVGHLAITIAGLRCELWPAGLALVRRDCRELALTGSRLELSSAALLKLDRPRRPPLAVGRVVLDDARLDLMASSLVPSLGRLAIAIEHADAGETVFKTPLSWIFALRELRATVELPGGVTLRLSYDNGQLQVSGGMFGLTPVTLPVTLPVRDLADDPAAEMAKLTAFGKDLGERLFLHRAKDWLNKLSPD